jgi:hypothetical protein
LTIVHLLVPDPEGPIIGMHHQFKIACNSGMPLNAKYSQSSVAAPAVTCSACKQTDAWKANMAAHTDEIAKDYELDIDKGTTKIVEERERARAGGCC